MTAPLLTDLRRQKRLGLRAFAEKLGFDIGRLSDIEIGYSPATEKEKQIIESEVGPFSVRDDIDKEQPTEHFLPAFPYSQNLAQFGVDIIKANIKTQRQFIDWMRSSGDKK